MGEKLKQSSEYKIVEDLVCHFSSYRENFFKYAGIVHNFFVCIWIATILIFSGLEIILPNYSIVWLLSLSLISLFYFKYLKKITFKITNFYLKIFNKDLLNKNSVYDKYGNAVLHNIKNTMRSGSNGNFSELIIIKTLEDLQKYDIKR